MIDPNVEELIPLTRAARVINPQRPPHVATVWRWTGNGVRGVRLESLLVGGVRNTSREAIGRFLAKLNADEPGAVPAPPNRRAEKAAAELQRRGC
jgi:hypothetical protein